MESGANCCNLLDLLLVNMGADNIAPTQILHTKIEDLIRDVCLKDN